MNVYKIHRPATSLLPPPSRTVAEPASLLTQLLIPIRIECLLMKRAVVYTGGTQWCRVVLDLYTILYGQSFKN